MTSSEIVHLFVINCSEIRDSIDNIYFFLNRNCRSPNEALQAISGYDSFEALLLCGKLHMKLQDYDEALNCMLKATRLQPHIAECFDYLARLYQANGDISRARKCFEKCISLNALSQQTVDSLSSIYQQLGEEDLNETLLLNTLRYLTNNEAVRLQYKLGLHFLRVNKWDNVYHRFLTVYNCILYLIYLTL